MISGSVKTVNELFTENTTDELQRIVRQKRTEVERKKDELRQLVGERHRDIVDASDRILLMRNLTFEVSGLLEQLRSSLSIWNQDVVKKDPSTETKSHELSIAAQLKLMLDIPELIWNYMDVGQHVSSARMSCLGRHLNARLNLSRETQLSHINAKVLVSRAWDSLVHMEAAVILACRRRLCAPPSTREEILDSLAALVVLEDLDLPQVLEEYFKARTVALYCILGRDHTSHQEVTKLKPNFILPVRKQLSLIIRFISSTLEYLEFLFMPNSSGESPIYGEALHTQLISLTDRKFQDSSTFSKDRLYTHLPNDVLSFKLKMCKFSSNLSHSIQEEGHSILVDLLHKSWKTWRNDAIEACQGVLSESLSHVSCFETLVDLRTVTLALVQRLQTPSSLVTKTTDYFTATPDFRQFTFDIWAELLSDLFLQRLKVLFTETLEDSFNDWITQFDELLTLNSRLTVQNEDLVPKTQLINRSSLKNPVEEGQIDWADFVWSDGMRDINVNSSSIMKDSVLCEASSGKESLTESIISSKNAILSHLVQSNNVGLAVFCCLAYTPIPNSFSLMASEKEQDLTSSSQLLVFLQRLVSENISSASNCTHISSFGNTDLEKKLHILLPDLQSLCEKLNMDISNRIIKLTSNVGRDSFDIWSLVLSALEKSLKRLANWITNKAYGKEIINNGDCPDVSLLLKVNPCCGLLLSRAWYALVDCCPSIIAASIAAIGQIESGRTMNAGLGNSTNSTKSTENISTIEGLVWTNISLLRRGWESLSQPLFELVNRITLDSLLNATVKNSVFEEFSDNLRLMTSIRFKKTDNEFTNCTKPNLSFNEDTVEGLLLKYTTVDVMLRGIVPFEEVQLELDSSQATEDMDTSLAAVIHVPSQLSLPMHQMLLNIVYVMEKLLVHRPLQPPYNHIFLSKVCTCFLDVYSTVVDELFSQRDISDQHSDDSSLWLSDSLQKLIQTRALQIIFDLKFLQRLLVSSVFVSEANLFQKSQTDASSKNVQTSVQGLISRLETLVDPFDWNVCASRLSRNVTNAITSTYHLYAPIIGSSSFSQIETLRGVKSSSKEEVVDNKTAVSFLPFISGTKSKTKLNLTPLPLNSSVCVNKWSILRTGNIYSKQI